MALDDSRCQDVDHVRGEAADAVRHANKHPGTLKMVVALDVHLNILAERKNPRIQHLVERGGYKNNGHEKGEEEYRP